MKDRLLRRQRPLITSPLEWQMTVAPVSHPVIPVLAERGGTQLQTPRATLLVDTREQNAFNLARFRGWFAGVEKRALPLGDYSIAGLEEWHCDKGLQAFRAQARSKNIPLNPQLENRYLAWLRKIKAQQTSERVRVARYARAVLNRLGAQGIICQCSPGDSAGQC